MSEKFRNKYRIPSARLKNWDYGSNAAYFITICTKDRCKHFGRITEGLMHLNEIGKIANKYWYQIPEHFPFVELGNFIVMPNHVHGIILINNDDRDAIQTPNLNDDRDDRDAIQTPKLNDDRDDRDAVQTPNLNDDRDDRDAVQTPKLGVSSDNSYSKSGGKKIEWKPGTIGVIINQYKRICTIHARKIDPSFAWQPRFHDHIIRNGESFIRISEYIANNPSKWREDTFYGH